MQQWISKLEHGPDPKGRFTWRNNILYFRDRIWLGGMPELQRKEQPQNNLNYAKQKMKKQSSVAKRASHKLAFQYFGPYSIVREINPVAYEVELPPDARIHPISHVSQLGKVLRPGTHASVTPPVVTDIPATPVKLISKRWRRGANGRIAQVQVQWSDPAAGDITWEDEQALRRRFPEALAWGQASFQGEGDVSSLSTSTTNNNDMGLVTKRTRPKRLIQPNRNYMGPDWTK